MVERKGKRKQENEILMNTAFSPLHPRKGIQHTHALKVKFFSAAHPTEWKLEKRERAKRNAKNIEQKHSVRGFIPVYFWFFRIIPYHTVADTSYQA